MAVQIRPAEASEIARCIGAVVPQEKNRIAYNILFCVFDADVAVGGGNVLFRIFLEAFLGVIGKDNIGSWGLERYQLWPLGDEGKVNLHDSVHNPLSYKGLSYVDRRYGMLYGCKARSSGEQLDWRR
jgi:hypothetical protein